jgi:hypothetical protein
MTKQRGWQLGWVVLASVLLGCGSTDTPVQKQVPVAMTSSPEPSVTATTRHYLRLLTQAAPPPTDSLTHYYGLAAQPDVVPGRLLLRLPTYTIVVQPDSLYPQVMIEPAARTELYNSRPAAATAPTTSDKKPVQLVLTTRKTNPALAVSLPELVATFGQWRGDDYAPVEEPLEPDMHTTEIPYRNPATHGFSRITVRLQAAPQAPTNAVHDIRLARARQLP